MAERAGTSPTPWKSLGSSFIGRTGFHLDIHSREELQHKGHPGGGEALTLPACGAFCGFPGKTAPLENSWPAAEGLDTRLELTQAWADRGVQPQSDGKGFWECQQRPWEFGKGSWECCWRSCGQSQALGWSLWRKAGGSLWTDEAQLGFVPSLPAGMSYSSSLRLLRGTEIIHGGKHRQLFPGGVQDFRNSNRTFLIFTAAAKPLKEKGNEG